MTNRNPNPNSIRCPDNSNNYPYSNQTLLSVAKSNPPSNPNQFVLKFTVMEFTSHCGAICRYYEISINCRFNELSFRLSFDKQWVHKKLGSNENIKNTKKYS